MRNLPIIYECIPLSRYHKFLNIALVFKKNDTSFDANLWRRKNILQEISSLLVTKLHRNCSQNIIIRLKLVVFALRPMFGLILGVYCWVHVVHKDPLLDIPGARLRRLESDDCFQNNHPHISILISSVLVKTLV